MNSTQTTLIALVAVNFALGLYLAWLFLRLRQELSAGRPEEPAREAESEAIEELLARVAGEIEQAAGEMSAHYADVDGRLVAFEEKLQSIAGDVDSLRAELRARPRPVEPDEDGSDAGVPEADRAGGGAAESFRQRHVEVDRLLAEGRSVPEIARLVRMSEGEVELVVGLRKRLSPQPADPRP